MHLIISIGDQQDLHYIMKNIFKKFFLTFPSIGPALTFLIYQRNTNFEKD
jgi:hypothetical protein